MAINLGGTWASIGSAMGQGLAKSIEDVMEMKKREKLYEMQMKYDLKAQQAQQQQYTNALEPIVGKEIAQFVGGLSPKEREVVMQNLGTLMQLGQRPIVQPQSGLGVLMQQPQQSEQSKVASMVPVQGSAFEKLMQLQGAPIQGPGFGAMQQARAPQANQNQSPLQMFQDQTNPYTKAMGQPSYTEATQDKQTQSKTDLLQDLFTPWQKKVQQQKLALAQEGNELKKEAFAGQKAKDVREFSKPYRERAEAATNNLRIYKEIIKLAKSGKLRAGNMHQLLSKVGLEGFDRNYETQLAAKLMDQLSLNARSAFGTGRLTNFLEQQYLKTLPTLWNTPEGIVNIATINSLAEEGEITKDKMRKDLIRANKGKLPFDIEDQIEEQARPIIQKLEDQALELAAHPISAKQRETVNELPDPAMHKGRRIRDTETGQILRSNGSKWVPQE